MSSRAFIDSMASTSSAVEIEEGKSKRNEFTPTCAQARVLLPTYTLLAGSSPTRMTARPGVTPVLRRRRAIRSACCSRIERAIALPSITLAVMGLSPGRT